jgi:hypothetical protein
MTQRQPATPPAISGYRYVQLLGSGGFSDVFLYEQEMPRREVAVKVLLGETGARVQQRFVDEANPMASLPSHPSIVTILHADVASDGRPYIVMAYYPGPNLRVQSRSQLPVAKVLSYGVQIACAVETAHRVGVLHRDIKPANILVNQYGIPALTDFGIAASTSGLATEEHDDSGLSAPEVLHSGRTADARSDVFSLAATAVHAAHRADAVRASGRAQRAAGPHASDRDRGPEATRLLAGAAVAGTPAASGDVATALGPATLGPRPRAGHPVRRAGAQPGGHSAGDHGAAARTRRAARRHHGTVRSRCPHPAAVLARARPGPPAPPGRQADDDNGRAGGADRASGGIVASPVSPAR